MCVLFFSCCGLLVAQQTKEDRKVIREEINAYNSRFSAGERGMKFMREYTFLVKEKGTVVDLEKIADEYLRLVPVKKRYTGENLEIFLSGIKDYRAVSFRELLGRWDCVDQDNKVKLGTHVEYVYKLALFNSCLNKKKLTSDFIELMRSDLDRVDSSDKEYCLMLLKMCVAANNEESDQVVRLFREHISTGNVMSWDNNWSDRVILGYVFNQVLESADKKLCEEMLGILKPSMDPEDKSCFFNSLYQNFEGKLLLLDPENQKAVCPVKPIVKEIKEEKQDVSGFMFNTSWGGVMTDKEYKFLRDVYSSSDDTLKQKYLHTLMQVFRYNGYTSGLEALKPLIEKNVRDCKEKREVLSRYKTYAHLASGKPAPEFKLKDMNGKEHALSDYRGKVVVVDVWATWCAGCIQKLPYFLKVRDHFKERDDVVFLVISIDQKEAYNRWKFAHPRYNLLDITSLIAHPDDCTFSDDYNITGIPRYFVIDREGKIVNVYAYAPDSPKFEKLINETLGERR